MAPRHQFRFPPVDLAIVAVLLFVGWSAFQLTRIDWEISSTREQSLALADIFKECQRLVRENTNYSESARREFDLSWYDALVLKAEYLNTAEHIQSNLAHLDRALTNFASAEGIAESQAAMRDLKSWIGKQRDRVLLERLDDRSKQWKERIAAAQLQGTNGPVKVTDDLGTLLGAIDRAYGAFQSDYRAVAANTGKPLVRGVVSQHVDQAQSAIAQLSLLAEQARRDGTAIDLFLETQVRGDAARERRWREQFIGALSEAHSPAEFTRRIRSVERPGSPAAAPSPDHDRLLREVRYGLLAVLVMLIAYLIINYYGRTVVTPLRYKLAERDAVNEHQRKLAQLAEMAAGLAHEIRNPLTTISARVYTIQRKLQGATPEHKDTLVIRSEIDHINQILKGFIQLTRPAAPKLAPMTAAPLLREIGELMPPQLQGHGVRLQCRAEGQTRFQGDPQQLKQVLVNLVQNAAESISNGGDHAVGGQIILRARDATVEFKGANAKVAIIEVEDNGPGIRPEVQERLFEPFYSTRKEGTGLGLPISARIIDRHGGTLDFETKVGRGTIFRIMLPACE